MQYPVCRHIKTNGTRCKSPSMTDNTWCFFHARIHRRHSSYRFTDKTSGYLRRGIDLQLCVLEDRDSVLFSLSLVVNALSTGNLEPDRARTLLYGLQLASQITARPATPPLAEDIIRSTTLDSDDLDLSDEPDLSDVADLELTVSEPSVPPSTDTLANPEISELAEQGALAPSKVEVQAALETPEDPTPTSLIAAIKPLPAHQPFDLSRFRPAPQEPISDNAESINERLADDLNRHCVKFA
ncbi:hypothetical protein BH10ACI4_BH10ACI4_35200 [soil metagenome]